MFDKYIIFEETKWCGAGNIASDCNDFGLYAETDKCCKFIIKIYLYIFKCSILNI